MESCRETGFYICLHVICWHVLFGGILKALPMLPIRCVVAGLMTLAIAASSHANDESLATSSRAAKENAIRSIPMNALKREAQEKVLGVINNTSIFRRLPASRYATDPDMHHFLIRYPEVIVGIWKVMDISKVQAERVQDFVVQASDGMGTTSTIELLYGTKNLHVFYGKGTYQGPLFHNRLNGSCILILRSDFDETLEGVPVVTDRLDIFLRVDNIGVKILARTLHPLVGKTADLNFLETTRFIGKVSKTAEVNGKGLNRLADQIQGLQPGVRIGFTRLIASTNEQAVVRLQRQLRDDYRISQKPAARSVPIRKN